MTLIYESVVTVLMPYYRGREYLEDAIRSIQAQTFCDWELLIIAEKDYDAADILERLMNEDKRIRVLINPGKQGLAESLNYGIEQAAGTYIARMDADDRALPERLEQQVEYMEHHPECGVCGTWQRHFGMGREWIHCPPIEHRDISASLIFNCEMCHSTVILRKSVMQKNNLYYDGSYAAEDYELWLRAVRVTQFHNLPEILGEYRWNGQNVTQSKLKVLSDESSQIVAKNIQQNFHLTVSPDHIPYLNGWNNEVAAAANQGFPMYRQVLLRERDLLQNIWNANQHLQVFQPESLQKVLSRRWKMVTGCTQYGRQVHPERSMEQLLSTARFAYFFYLSARCKYGIKRVLRRN